MATNERWETGNGDGSGIYLRTVRGDGTVQRARIGGFDEGGRAPGGSEAAVQRATLAAAAPDLYAALADLVDLIDRLGPIHLERMNRARAALAKAEGR